MEVQRDGSLEKGSVDLVLPNGNSTSGGGANGGILEGAPVVPNSHNTISYNDHSDSYE